MRLLFIINTPGQAHTWKHVISRLQRNGHVTKILARDYGSTPAILSSCGFQFETFETIGSGYSRLLGASSHFQKCYGLSRGFEPSIVIGFGIDAAVTASRFGKPSIVFIDDDHTRFQNLLTRLLGSAIVTPDCFRGDLGRKHVRVNGYKELAYLHPNYFHPDAAILDELGLQQGEKYIILRFNALDAVHDIGVRGFSSEDKVTLVKKLEEQARVFVSPEASLPRELDSYRLAIPYARFHHAIYYAQMFVGDTGTTATESAMLGTPAVFFNRNTRDMGNFKDMSQYGLMYHYYGDASTAINKAIELAQQPHLKEEFADKRRKMLAHKTDVGRFLADFIEDYPDSLAKAQACLAMDG